MKGKLSFYSFYHLHIVMVLQNQIVIYRLSHQVAIIRKRVYVDGQMQNWSYQMHCIECRLQVAKEVDLGSSACYLVLLLQQN